MSKNLQENINKDEIYVRLYLSAFKCGLVAKLKATNFTVLMTICSYMNEGGECWPTQKQIAERSGIGKTTVNKAINELLAFRFKGKPLISRKMVQTGYFKNSVYSVHPISQVAIFGGQVENIDDEKKPEPISVNTGDDALGRLQGRLVRIRNE